MKAIPKPNVALVWTAILLLSCVQAIGWWWFTPAWAAPDEPSHFLYTRLLSPASTPASDIEGPLEAAILASLQENHWWAYNHLPQPAVPLQEMAYDPTLAASGSQINDEPALFYRLAALWLTINPGVQRADLATQLRWLRLGSLLLRLLTVAITLALLLKYNRRTALGAGLLVGLLPMVGFIAGSHNNAVLAILWGSLVFAWMLVPAPVSGGRMALAWLLALAAPLLIDRSLIFLWPFTFIWSLYTVPRLQRYRLPLLIVSLLGLILLIVPNPRWASGWRHWPETAPSRTKSGLLLPATSSSLPLLSQTLSDKSVAGLHGQTLLLQAQIDNSPGILELTLKDNTHQRDFSCQTLAATCTWTFTVDPHATFIHLTASTRTPPLAFRLHLWDESGHQRLFNGDGQLPAPLGNPLFRRAERVLPVPAGFFDRALASSAWDAPSQFRYLLFEGFAWASFWGYFGWLSRPFPFWLYGLAAIASLAAAWGIFLLLMQVLRRYRHHELHPRDRLFLWASLALTLLLLQVSLPMAGQAWQPQGRYFFPALLPIAILLFLGWETALPRRWRPHLLPLLFILLGASNLLAWYVVTP